MAFTTENLTTFLGKPAQDVFLTAPFAEWQQEKTVDDEIEKIDYVFRENGVDFVCDLDNSINTIFIHNDAKRCFKVGIVDMPFNTKRETLVKRYGKPSELGDEFSDSDLGDFGAWIRFEFPKFAIHFEFHRKREEIKLITIMRPDVVP